MDPNQRNFTGPLVATPRDLAERLDSIDLFHGVALERQREIAGRFRPRRFARNTFIFHQGVPATSLHIVGDGRVKVIQETEDGREVILHIFNPGELFGAAGVWGETQYPASAVAQEDAVVWQLPVKTFLDLMEETPRLAINVLRVVTDRLRVAHSRIRELQTERVERRIARTILRLASKMGVKTPEGIAIGTPVSRQELADLSGTTLTTASRVLSSWESQGIIESGRERVTIRKPHQLSSIADDFGPASPA